MAIAATLGPVRLLSYTDKNFADELAAFCRGAAVPEETARAVTALLADVRHRGDLAVAEYAARFDGAHLTPDRFRVRRRQGFADDAADIVFAQHGGVEVVAETHRLKPPRRMS